MSAGTKDALMIAGGAIAGLFVACCVLIAMDYWDHLQHVEELRRIINQ